MASGRQGGDGYEQPSRDRQRGRASEDRLVELGSKVDAGRSAGRGSSGGGRGSDANESGLRALGDSVDRAERRKGRTGRRRRGGRRWSRRRKILTGVAVVLALLLVAVGGGVAYLVYRYDQIPKIAVPADEAELPGQPFNMLVIGSDSRVGESSSAFGSSSEVSGQRSDVVMIWHVNPATRQIQILSIPRDTMVQMVGSNVSQFGQFNRINAAYNSGANLLVETIEDNFGIPINHVVQLDFAGFEGTVNALGGVDMDFPYPAKDQYSGLDITTPGCQLLDGAQALAVARSRHYYYEADGTWEYDGTSDFGRIQRQDAFLKALVKTAEGKVNPLTVNAFLGSIHEGVTIDNGLGISEIVELAVDFHSFNPEALQTDTLPTTSIGYVSPWGDVLFVDQPAAQQMLVSVFGSQLTEPTVPPPDTSLVATPPPQVTTTTTVPPTPTPAGQAAPPAATTTTVPPYNPTPC